MCIYNGPMPETSESLLTFKGSLKMFQNLNDKYALKYTYYKRSLQGQGCPQRIRGNSDVDTTMAAVHRDLTVEKQHCVWLWEFDSGTHLHSRSVSHCSHPSCGMHNLPSALRKSIHMRKTHTTEEKMWWKSAKDCFQIQFDPVMQLGK